MVKREKLIRLLPVFFYLLTMLIILGFAICPQVFNSVLYLIVPFIGAGASRYYCVMKYPYKPKWERNFRVIILSTGLITIMTVIGYLILTSLI